MLERAACFTMQAHEKGRLMWCCGGGKNNVVVSPPLADDFYQSPYFLDRARAYNGVFALCAMNVTGGYWLVVC